MTQDPNHPYARSLERFATRNGYPFKATSLGGSDVA